MTVPFDAVLAIHNAFRNDIKIIDSAALRLACGELDTREVVERYCFLNEILVWHAHGEELAVFPELEKVAPLVAQAYIHDHHGLDEAFAALDKAVNEADPLETARASAAFKFHLNIHLDKEDAYVYRLMRERVPPTEHGKIVGMLSSTVPPERFPEVVAWMFPLMGNDDRENMTRIWQMVMPPPLFANIKGLIQKAVGGDWAELTRRIPSL